MADTSPTYLRGFLIPYDLSASNIWEAQKSFTQQDLYAGDPEKKTDTSLVVRSSGIQGANGDIQIVTRRAGQIGRCGFTLRDNNLSTTVEYGRDAANAFSGWETIEYTSGGATGTSANFPFPLDLGDGSLLVAVQYRNPLGAYARQIRIYKRTTAGAFTNVDVFNWVSVTGLTQNNLPTLCILPDESILCAFLYEDSTEGTATIRIYRSTDSGASWDLASRTALDSKITVGSAGATYTIEKIKMAAISGQIVLFIETIYNDGGATYRNRLFQYASVDGGGSFQLVTSNSDLTTQSFRSINVFAYQNIFVLSYIGELDEIHYMPVPHAFYSAHILRSASAYTVASTDTVATGTDQYMQQGALSCWRDEDEQIYILYEDMSGSANGKLKMKWTEEGNNFEYMSLGSNNSVVFWLNDTTTKLEEFAGSSNGGKNVIVHNWDSTSTTGNSLGIAYLGGFSSVNMPKMSESEPDLDYNRCGFQYTYIPLDLPSDLSIFTVTGTGTDSLGAGYLQTNLTNLETFKKYKMSLVGDPSNGILLRSSFTAVQDGTGATLSYRYLKLQTEDVANDYDIEFRVYTNQFLLYDVNAGAQIGITVSFDSTAGIDVIISLKANAVKVFYRAKNFDSLRTWINGPSSTTLNNGGGGGATSADLTFGHPIPPTAGTGITRWNEVLFQAGSGVGKQLTSFITPFDLNARLYPSNSEFVYVFDGVKISTSNGPTYEGEEFQIKTRYGYPIENIFHQTSPTPRIQWRSQGVTSGSCAEQFIPLQLDTTSTSSNISLGNDLIGLHLSNINFFSLQLQYYDIAGASWTTLKTIPTYSGMRGAFLKRGKSIIPNSGGTNEWYLFQDEAKDWIAAMYIGASYEFSRIVSNTEGFFGTSATTKQAVIQLETAPSGDGLLFLIPKALTAAISLNGIQSPAWGLRITAQETIDKDIRIGHFSLGPIIVTGRQYSKNRSLSIEAGSVEFETPDGVLYSRKLKPSRRRLDISWSEGVDISTFYNDPPIPNYWTSSTTAGALPIAAENDVPYNMIGILRYLEGSNTPLVYLPSIPRSTAPADDLRIFNRRSNQLLGVIDGDIAIDSVLGSENIGDGQGEVFRVANITIKEVI